MSQLSSSKATGACPHIERLRQVFLARLQLRGIEVAKTHGGTRLALVGSGLEVAAFTFSGDEFLMRVPQCPQDIPVGGLAHDVVMVVARLNYVFSQETPNQFSDTRQEDLTAMRKCLRRR